MTLLTYTTKWLITLRSTLMFHIFKEGNEINNNGKKLQLNGNRN